MSDLCCLGVLVRLVCSVRLGCCNGHMLFK